MATLNIGMKVSRAIGGATTVNANAMAIVYYHFSGVSGNTPQSFNGPPALQPVVRVFGPGQSIPASFTTVSTFYGQAGNAPLNLTLNWSLQSGVELINTQ